MNAGVGLDVELQADGQWSIAGITPGGDAAKQPPGTIDVGDILLSCDGKNLNGCSMGEVRSVLKGTEGSVASITIMKKATMGIQTLQLTRARINPPPAAAAASTTSSNGFPASTGGGDAGVGIIVFPNERNEFVIVKVIPGGSAAEAGPAVIGEGDYLMEVAHENVCNLKMEQIASRLKGYPGTQVALKVHRPGDVFPTDITLVRKTVDEKVLKYCWDHALATLNLQAYAPPTIPLAPQTLEDLNTRRLCGIGVIWQENEQNFEVANIVPRSSADLSGKDNIAKGDILIAVDGKATTGMNMQDLYKALIGYEGTTVALNLYRPGIGQLNPSFVRAFLSEEQLKMGMELIKSNEETISQPVVPLVPIRSPPPIPVPTTDLPEKEVVIIPPEQLYHQPEEQFTNEICSVGILVVQDPATTKFQVGQITIGGSAFRAGSEEVAVGDWLISIDDWPCKSQPHALVAEKLKGKDGSFLELELERNGKIRRIRLQRRPIEVVTTLASQFSSTVTSKNLELTGGLGVILKANTNGVVVEGTVPGSPSSSVFLPNDIILAVDGRSMGGKTAADAGRVLPGPIGSWVTIEYLRPGDRTPSAATLQRVLIDPRAAIRAVETSVPITTPQNIVETAGVGLVINVDKLGNFVVANVVPGGPADLGWGYGLKSNDVIVSVNGHDMHAITIAQLSNFITGPVGSSVEIEFLRPGESQTRRVGLTRAKIDNYRMSAAYEDAKMKYQVDGGNLNGVTQVDLPVQRAIDEVEATRNGHRDNAIRSFDQLLRQFWPLPLNAATAPEKFRRLPFREILRRYVRFSVDVDDVKAPSVLVRLCNYDASITAPLSQTIRELGYVHFAAAIDELQVQRLELEGNPNSGGFKPLSSVNGILRLHIGQFKIQRIYSAAELLSESIGLGPSMFAKISLGEDGPVLCQTQVQKSAITPQWDETKYINLSGNLHCVLMVTVWEEHSFSAPTPLAMIGFPFQSFESRPRQAGEWFMMAPPRSDPTAPRGEIYLSWNMDKTAQ